MTYDIDITELVGGKFAATYRDCPDIELISSDPEHEICYRMAQLGFADGAVQFWRDGVRTLNHSSLKKMAKMFGDRFPKRVKRSEWQGSRQLQDADGQNELLEGDGAKA